MTPNSDPRDGFFYPTLTLMIDSYNLSVNHLKKLHSASARSKMSSNSYTMGCPPVRGDNPRALASGLSHVQEDKHGITILYHLHQCRPSTS